MKGNVLNNTDDLSAELIVKTCITKEYFSKEKIDKRIDLVLYNNTDEPIKLNYSTDQYYFMEKGGKLSSLGIWDYSDPRTCFYFFPEIPAHGKVSLKIKDESALLELIQRKAIENIKVIISNGKYTVVIKPIIKRKRGQRPLTTITPTSPLPTTSTRDRIQIDK